MAEVKVRPRPNRADLASLSDPPLTYVALSEDWKSEASKKLQALNPELQRHQTAPGLQDCGDRRANESRREPLVGAARGQSRRCGVAAPGAPRGLERRGGRAPAVGRGAVRPFAPRARQYPTAGRRDSTATAPRVQDGGPAAPQRELQRGRPLHHLLGRGD